MKSYLNQEINADGMTLFMALSLCQHSSYITFILYTIMYRLSYITHRFIHTSCINSYSTYIRDLFYKVAKVFKVSLFPTADGYAKP